LLPLQVDQTTDFAELVNERPWLKTTQLVVKPDMLFGKRGKNDLLALNVNISEAESFIHARMNKQVTGQHVLTVASCVHRLVISHAMY
jgi:ATP citrate (pro-S)-lyase